jgi:hypothetical protein
MAVEKHPELPNIPNVFDLVKSEADRNLLKLVFGPWSFGRPLLAPPGIPEDRLQALRAAFEATMRDPGFLAEAKRINLEVQPVSAERIDALVAELYQTPQPVIEQARQVLGIGNR